jgi:hypothetical protein
MQTAAGRYSRTYFHHLLSREFLPLRAIKKWSRILKNIPHPMAANLLQKRHIDISGADMAIANPNDQMVREIVRVKNIRFVLATGFV